MRSVFILCFCLVVAPALSQEAKENDQEADSLSMKLLTEVTISANRWEQSIVDVPGKVTTISQALINFENPQTAADLLSLSNNVFIQKSQLGGGSPMLRGFATNRVLLVVDGVRMNNAIFRSGNVQNVISLDANAIEEAEILFGPGAVMYGSDAIGGVMDFHTLGPVYSPDSKPRIHARGVARYSSANNERMLHADLHAGWKKFALVSSVSRSLYGDLRMGSNGPDDYLRPDYVVRENGEDVVKVNRDPEVQKNSGFDQWNAMQKIFFAPHDGFEASYSFHYSKTSDYPRYDRLIARDENGLTSAEWYYGPQKWTMHHLQLKYSVATSLFDQAKLIAAFQDFSESRHNRNFGAPRRTNRFENVKAFSVNLDLDKALNAKTTLFYGGEYVTNNVYSKAYRFDVNTAEVSPATTRYPNDSDWRSGALYASLRYKPSSFITTNVSVRATHISMSAVFDQALFGFPFSEANLDNTAVNASLGIVYHPNYALKVYANLSTGFRAPNIDDVGKLFNPSPGTVIVPNPDLNAEYAYNAEIGLATIISKRLKFDMAAYYTLLDDAIARGYDTFNGQEYITYDDELSRVTSLQNISRIWVGGLQAGVEFDVTERISLRSNASYQRGNEKNPEADQDYSPTHVAPFFGSTHLIYRNDLLRLDLSADYNGRISYNRLPLSERLDTHLYAKDRNGNPYSPEWMTINLKSSWQLIKDLTLDIGVENIFDKRYRPYASGISAPGRNFIVAMRARI